MRALGGGVRLCLTEEPVTGLPEESKTALLITVPSMSSQKVSKMLGLRPPPLKTLYGTPLRELVSGHEVTASLFTVDAPKVAESVDLKSEHPGM